MNKRLQQLKAEGYQYTGATFKEWDKELANAQLAEAKKVCKQFGSKATLVRNVETTNFRNSSSKSVFLCIYILYSEAHKEFIAKKNQEQREANHKSTLRYLVDKVDGLRNESLSLEDLQYMLNYKIEQLKNKEI